MCRWVTKPEYWYEPFGGRYYWNWENYFFEAPEDATYTVALWHPEEQLGRYSFVIGEEEIRGGDPECMASLDDYWTPLLAGENPYRDTRVSEQAHTHADGTMHDHGTLLEVSEDPAPFVDLQVIPLDDGGYNVRVQTLNFIFAPHHVGMEPMAGEGHAHLYIDGVKDRPHLRRVVSSRITAGRCTDDLRRSICQQPPASSSRRCGDHRYGNDCRHHDTCGIVKISRWPDERSC